MSYSKLKDAADIAIDKIEKFSEVNGGNSLLESILNQMIFIRDNASKGKHPANLLNQDKKFTFSIIASRELVSPEERKLYEYITQVSRIMDSIEH